MSYTSDMIKYLKAIARNTNCNTGTSSSFGATSDDTVAATNTTTVHTLSAEDQVRAVEILPISGGTPGTGSDGLATVVLTTEAGDALTFQILHNASWNYQGGPGTSPIVSVAVTNDDTTTAFRFITNVSAA